MAWQRFNRTSNVFEVSDNNGASWEQIPNIPYKNQANSWSNVNSFGLINCTSIEASSYVRTAGGLYDNGRGVPIGDYTPVAFSAGNFSGFTVGTQHTNEYTIIGHTFIWNFAFSGTCTSTGIELYMVFPPGILPAKYQAGALGYFYNNSVQYDGHWYTAPGNGALTLRKLGFTAFQLGNFELQGSISVRMS